MLRITEMQDKCDKLAVQAHEILQADPLPQDKYAEAEAMLAERDELLERISLHKRTAEAHDALMQPEHQAPVTTAGFRDTNLTPRNRHLKLIETPEYKEAFFDSLINGTQLPAEFRNILTTDNTGQDMSATIPTELEESINVFRELANPLRGLCTVSSHANDRDFPLRTADAVAARFAENAAIDIDTTYAMSKITLGSNKMGVIVQATTESLEDSRSNLESDMISSIGRAFGNLEETEIVSTGSTGSTPEMTTLKGACGTEVTAVANTGLDYDSLVNMIHGSQIEAAYVADNGGITVGQSTAWVMSHGMVGYCRKVKDDNNLPIWQPGMGSEPDRLLGFPLVRSKAMPAAPSASLAGGIYFGDFSEYLIADRRMFNIKRLNELYAANDAIGWLATARNDGKIRRATAFSEMDFPA